MNNPYTMHKLDNGLQIVIEKMPDVRSAAAGFLVRTGARDEVAPQAGVSHFLEHMMFKGTAKRGWRDITIALDDLGSQYNAFTSEDRTVYYGWVRKADLEKQIEILADMLRSTLPGEEFDMEKNVVLEEIAMAKDSLEHIAFDFVQEKVFAGHPLAWPVLGYEKTVQDLSRDTMWDYFKKRYTPDNIVLVVSGQVDPAAIIDLAEKYCGSWKPGNEETRRTPPEIKGGIDSCCIDRFNQQILILTLPAVCSTDRLVESASAVATILGGDNSRFFWNIVQAGVSTRAGAYLMDYSDYGAMLLYGACQPENAEKLLDAIRRESKRICEDGVQEEEVDRVKNRRRTSLALESETPYHRLTHLMDDIEYRGGPRTVEQMLADVDAVSVQTVREYLERYPLDAAGHLASVGPRAWPTES